MCRKLRKDMLSRWKEQAKSLAHARLLERDRTAKDQARSLLCYAEACGIENSSDRFNLLRTWKQWLLENITYPDLAQSSLAYVSAGTGDEHTYS